MSPKPSPNSLIHCAVCGEDYSATYRRCPFCGAKNAPGQVPASGPAPAPGPAPASGGGDDLDDGYVFEGQDVFDDEYEDEDYRPVRPKGGKRLAEKPSSPFVDAQVNWPRLITFLCSIIIIITALVIVFTVVYPQLRDSKNGPGAAVSDPLQGPSEPVTPPSAPPSLPVVDPTDPPVDPSGGQPSVNPNVGEPTGLTLNKYDFTLRPDPDNNHFQLKATVTPADWAGTVTWESTDPSLATVSATGLVTHAKPDVTGVHMVLITAHAGGLEAKCKVYITGPKNSGSQPSASEPPTDPPVTVTTSGGSVTVGRAGTIVGADGGLRVRSGPGTSYDVVASLVNGNTVTVVSDAGGGWYQISFSGSGGAAMTGYIMGVYISTN